MDKRVGVLILAITVATCGIYSAYVLSMTQTIPTENRVNLTGVNCTISANIGRKLFFHVCRKENKTVYDVRYFYKNEDEILKAGIIGVQMNRDEFKKVCKYCATEV